ncbi:MAG: NAD(P)H-dependent oxidoreductase [Albidovulum sp.]|nr:NAD(P)H-dependent oxidoreductase [Albidovulum sp.]
MRALVVYCHPRADSFTAAVRDVVVEQLRLAGAEIRISDLYARGFQPVLGSEELDGYLDSPSNELAVADDVSDIRWCDTLVFIYPTWWYGLPAMLKGWLDRTMLPGVAFTMPQTEGGAIKPALSHITGVAAFTTCGASRWLTLFMGSQGRKTILRSLRLLCAPGTKTAFAAHYLMDSSTPESRRRHLENVQRISRKFAARCVR